MEPEDLSYAAEKCAKLIKKAERIGVLTGAGISTNAGIPDFRGPRGLYVTRQYDPEKVFDIHYFRRDAKPFYDFARDFIGLEERIKPTPAHYFLAELENAGKLKGVVTQNIDSLHQRAGSRNVYEMHGSFELSHCLDCKQAFPFTLLKEKLATEVVPSCNCGGVIKPDIVFFGEDVKHFADAVELAEASDLFLVIGTSGVVQPAAQVPAFASGDIVIINKGEVELKLYNIALKVNMDADKFLEQVGFYI